MIQRDDVIADGHGRRAAGQAVRDLGHALVGHDADGSLLAEVASTLGDLTVRLDGGASRSRPPDQFGNREGVGTDRGVPVESYDDRPFSGRASPWGLDLDVHRVGDEIEAHVTLRAAHEGAPGRAHGGIVAGLFDDVFGFVLGAVHVPAFTGELSVRYVCPTPLHRPLRCCGRLAERSGRKLVITGELFDATQPDQGPVATGSGLFIAVDPELFGQTMQLPAPPATA